MDQPLADVAVSRVESNAVRVRASEGAAVAATSEAHWDYFNLPYHQLLVSDPWSFYGIVMPWLAGFFPLPTPAKRELLIPHTLAK